MIAAEDIRAAALSVPGVQDLHRGPHGTASTFSTSGRVWGVRLDERRIDVHLVALSGFDLRALGDQVRDAVNAAAGGYAGTVSVHIEDLAVPAQIATDDPAGIRDSDVTSDIQPSDTQSSGTPHSDTQAEPHELVQREAEPHTPEHHPTRRTP